MSYVCLHGFTGTPDAFLPLGLETLWAPFLTGHGPDPDLQSKTFDDEVARISTGIRKRSVRPVHLVAYSMGARLALGLLVNHPSMFSRATLLGVNPGLSTEEARQDRLGWEARWIDILEQDGLAVFEHQWRCQPLFKTQHSLPPRSQDAQRSARLSHTAAGLVHALHVLGLGSMPSYWAHLQRIRVPTTLLYGALDEKFARIAHEVEGLGNSLRAMAIPDVGHNPLIESPRAVRECLMEATFP